MVVRTLGRRLGGSTEVLTRNRPSFVEKGVASSKVVSVVHCDPIVL
jgi:hypothetical protein